MSVIKSSDPRVKGKGWVLVNSLQDLSAGRKRKTTRGQTFFKAGLGLPTLQLNEGRSFPVGTRFRIQEFRGEWALVAMLDRLNGLGEVDKDHGRGGLEGWLLKEFVSRKADEP